MCPRDPEHRRFMRRDRSADGAAALSRAVPPEIPHGVRSRSREAQLSGRRADAGRNVAFVEEHHGHIATRQRLGQHPVSAVARDRHALNAEWILIDCDHFLVE